MCQRALKGQGIPEEEPGGKISSNRYQWLS